MGMHATGHLFFGYDLKQMLDNSWEYMGPSWLRNDEGDLEEMEWAEQLARVRGIAPVPFPHNAFDRSNIALRGGRLDESHEDFITWKKWRDEVSRIERESSIELMTYGYVDDGETSWAVAVKSSTMEADYECVDVRPVLMQENTRDWESALLRFAEELELPLPKVKPTWMIASSYG